MKAVALVRKRAPVSSATTASLERRHVQENDAKGMLSSDLGRQRDRMRPIASPGHGKAFGDEEQW